MSCQCFCALSYYTESHDLRAVNYAVCYSHTPQDKYHDADSKYKDSMLANAQLYNEKTALVYQVEVLKDRLVNI